MKADLKEIFSNYKGQKAELIQLLQEVQSQLGYLSEEALLEISKFVNVPESEVYGVATFYAQFRFTPVGRNHIMVCTGTACHVQGAQQILEGLERHLEINEGETTKDMEYSIESVGCLGCCALAPCAIVGEDVKSRMTLRKIKKLFPKNES